MKIYLKRKHLLTIIQYINGQQKCIICQYQIKKVLKAKVKKRETLNHVEK